MASAHAHTPGKKYEFVDRTDLSVTARDARHSGGKCEFAGRTNLYP